MIAVQTQERELFEAWSETDESRRMKADFPIFSGVGAASTSVVYFELEPGHHCGAHTDSAEEVVLILEGEAEAVVGDERGRLSTGGLALVPALVSHDVINVGDTTLKIVGFFSSAVTVSVFDDPLLPLERRVVGTPLPEEEALTAAV